MPARVPAGVGAHLQVLQHRHAGEDAPALGRLADPADHPQVGAQVGDVLPVEPDPAGGDRAQPGDGPHGGGLAGAVRADQGDDLALVDAAG